MRRIPAALAALGLLAALAACSSDPGRLVDDYNSGDAAGGYISGDGSVRTIPATERAAANAFAGPATDGSTISSEDFLGDVVVLNFWYAACPPCRLEAPDLEQLHQDYAAQGVDFVGVNVSDGLATAEAFNTEHGVTYPSILDAESNDVLLAFAGSVSANAVPTTLILDREGRVAARFSGLIDSPSLVAEILDETLAEES